MCRMYQALLASGDKTMAQKFVKKIPQDDPHVRLVIKECNDAFASSASVKKKKHQKKQRGILKAALGLLDLSKTKAK